MEEWSNVDEMNLGILIKIMVPINGLAKTQIQLYVCLNKDYDETTFILKVSIAGYWESNSQLLSQSIQSTL